MVQGPSTTGDESSTFPCCVLSDVAAVSVVATGVGFSVCCIVLASAKIRELDNVREDDAYLAYEIA
jgi:hypothetical protein